MRKPVFAHPPAYHHGLREIGQMEQELFWRETAEFRCVQKTGCEPRRVGAKRTRQRDCGRERSLGLDIVGPPGFVALFGRQLIRRAVRPAHRNRVNVQSRAKIAHFAKNHRVINRGVLCNQACNARSMQEPV